MDLVGAEEGSFAGVLRTKLGSMKAPQQLAGNAATCAAVSSARGTQSNGYTFAGLTMFGVSVLLLNGESSAGAWLLSGAVGLILMDMPFRGAVSNLGFGSGSDLASSSDSVSGSDSVSSSDSELGRKFCGVLDR